MVGSRCILPGCEKQEEAIGAMTLKAGRGWLGQASPAVQRRLNDGEPCRVLSREVT